MEDTHNKIKKKERGDRRTRNGGRIKNKERKDQNRNRGKRIRREQERWLYTLRKK